jgi:hypothetical protein
MISIGVTAHRVLAEVEKINGGIADALKKIEQKFPGELLTIISPLAEGADRLVVHQVLEHPDARLIVPLPLPKQDYLQDFAFCESKNEFLQLLHRADEVIELPPTGTRNAAYEAAGKFVLDRCDVLIAVWDGQTARGQGGTGEILTLARSRHLPIAWVHAGNRKPGTNEPTTLGAEQGTVTFENF